MKNKCAVYKVRSKGLQDLDAKGHLQRIWTDSADENQHYNFKQPSKEEREALYHLYPLEEKLYETSIVAFATGGEDGSVYPVAIVINQDGFLEHVELNEIKIINQHYS